MAGARQTKRSSNSGFPNPPAHRMAYWRVKSAWDRAQRLHVLRTPAGDAAKEEWAPRLPPIFARTAAALALLVGVGTAALVFTSSPRETAYATGVGGREVVALSDGSKIELNTNTSLRVRLSKRERSVILEKGEAFFQVKHDANRPFTVLAGNRRITDIGTKFVRATRRAPFRSGACRRPRAIGCARRHHCSPHPAFARRCGERKGITRWSSNANRKRRWSMSLVGGAV